MPPQTPLHSRTTSLAELSPQVSPSNRRQSRSSLESSTPVRGTFNQADHLDISTFTEGGVIEGSGLGNLADELADAFSDSENGDTYSGQDDTGISFSVQHDVHLPTEAARDIVRGAPQAYLDSSDLKNGGLGVPLSSRRGHRRAISEYDGSEYGSESDLDSPGMPTGLVSRINAVEALARRGTENTGGHSDGVFFRLADALRDLGSQTGVESSATRYFPI